MYCSKLTEAEVREIRRRYDAGGVKQTELAKEYEVSKHTISLIVKRHTWKHVTDSEHGIEEVRLHLCAAAAALTASR